MTTYEAISLYGTQKKLADALGITQSAVSMWGEFPPDKQQMRLERLTRGRLRAETDVFSPKRKKAA